MADAPSPAVASGGNFMFSTPIILSVIGVLGLIALFFYIYRTNQDNSTKTTEHSAKIIDLYNHIGLLQRKNAELETTISMQSNALKQYKKWRKAVDKRIETLGEQIYDLGVTDSGESKEEASVSSASKKKQAQKKKKARFQNDSSDDDSSDDDDEAEEYQKELEKLKNKGGKAKGKKDDGSLF